MNTEDLRVFATVARCGGMNRAAAELHTVQSNVSARIRALEEQLGVVLFRRHRRGVSLTNAGLRLLPYAKKVALLLAEARHEVQNSKTPKGPLAIGSLETTAAQRLAPVIAIFGKANPDVDLTLKIGTNASLVRQVLDRELDGAFVCAPVVHPDLRGDTVFREELVLATAPGVKEPLLQGDCRILVKGAGCAYRERLETTLARRGISEFRRLEFGTLEAIIGCVAAGLGFTLLPRTVLERAEKEGQVRLHQLTKAESNVETVFVRRRDLADFGALRAFMAKLPADAA